ncbi:MAG: 4-(cytidine 5'-diphospho)-2-C-methyl-D-erythritol kinase [Bacteroidales bacterium]|nr:4-(cytidine 5'-diphospho)-2-C-methyl-D-erythritol kinase [Bacteroidales bacterium]
MISYPNVKVNIGLNVLRRREDGYHDLETLFFPYFEISDVLEITAGDDYSRTSASLFARYRDVSMGACSETGGMLVQEISADGKLMITIARREGVDWNPLDDLTAKAYFLLAEDFSLPAVKIWLEKRSPVGAGLGGGSSDAAFALRMLNEMFSLGLDEAALASYAARLGSDCAFFIYNRPMLGEGRGEILTDYPMPVPEDAIRQGFLSDGYRIKVVVPDDIQVSTAEAYRGIRPHLPDLPLREILAKPIEEWKALLVNDFEETVLAAHPELAVIKQSLYDSGASYASMSGSGSAFFGIYHD